MESVKQHPERRNQDALRLLLPHWSSSPAFPERPFSDASLEPDHVPHARARRARHATQRLQGMVHAPSGLDLPLVELGLASCAWYPQQRQCAECVKVRDDERRLEIAMSDRGQDGGGSAKYVAAIRSSRDKGAGEVDRPARSQVDVAGYAAVLREVSR
jgi:hypothetical protein